jgi:hypothetical protein
MGSFAELETFENESTRFDSLMSFKIQNILLVSSLYDIYNLREDGQLTDMLLAEYSEFRLSSAPVIKRVDSGTSALEALKESEFELVIVLRTLSDIDSVAFPSYCSRSITVNLTRSGKRPGRFSTIFSSGTAIPRCF